MSTPQPQPRNGTVQSTLQLPPKPSRMTLSSLVKGKLDQPLRVLLYGQEGVGKSTFAASAPAPIFLGAEDGTAQLDVVRFPTPESWNEVLEAVATLTNEQHKFQTLVVDTLDWVEPLLWAHMIRRDRNPKNDLKTIEDYGYGKGYNAALDDWRVLLAALERLRKAKGMHVVLLAHSWIKSFKNPEGDDFDRYELKLNAKAAGLWKEWADDVLFARFEILAHKDTQTRRVRGVSTGARLIHTERTAAYDAKNRHSLPEELPLAWADYEAAVKAGKVSEPGALRAEIERKAKELGGDLEKAILETLPKAGDDVSKLVILNNKVNAKLAEKGK